MKILTYSGHMLDLEDPDPNLIDPIDIAHALSNLARYNGHTREFYSVAQHSMLACAYAPRGLKLQALLHDAAEAYVGDLVGPIKISIPYFEEIEQRVFGAIAEVFGMKPKLDPVVMEIDRRLLATEFRDLFGHSVYQPKLAEPYADPIVPMDAAHAKVAFMTALHRRAPDVMEYAT